MFKNALGIFTYIYLYMCMYVCVYDSVCACVCHIVIPPILQVSYKIYLTILENIFRIPPIYTKLYTHFTEQ